jgi:hypothetical protein
MFVYVIVNSETLKIYVGQHKGTNLRKYLQTKLSDAAHQVHLRSHLFASMRKHQKEVWSIHSLISDLQTREECDYWERMLIKALNSQNSEVGYNICRGGEGHAGPAWNKGRPNPAMIGNRLGALVRRSPEGEARRMAAVLGRKRTPAQRAKMSAAQMGNKKGVGHKLTPEHIAKLTASRTPEGYARVSAAKKKWWAEHRAQ